MAELPKFEFSRRRPQGKTLNFVLRFINYIQNYTPIEIVDRATGKEQHNPNFCYIYVSIQDNTEL